MSSRGYSDGVWSDAIDVHHHAVPDFYLEEIRRIGCKAVLPSADKPSWNVESSLSMMDRQGIRAAVLNVWPGVPPMDPTPAAALARRVNEYLAELVVAHPRRLGAFAVLPFPHVDEVLREFEYSVDILGLDGIGLITNYDGVYVGDRSLEPFLEEASRRRTPLFVHPGLPPSSGQPAFGLPESLYEFPFDTVRMVAQLLYNGTLERFPDLRLILSHGGGGVAYYAHRLTYGPLISAALGDRLANDPISAVQRLYFDVAMSGDEYTLPALRAFAPPDRLLVGTDFPFMPESFSRESGRHIVEKGGIGLEEFDRLDHLNAETMFPRLRREKG